MACLAVGCARQPAPAEPALPDTPRLVSLAPNLTEIVWTLGAASALAGRTSACDFPPDVRRVPVVGGYGDPSLEMLLAVRPTVVLYADLADKMLANRLQERGIRTRWIPCTRLADIPAAIAAVGEEAGCRETGDRMAAALRAEIAAVRAETGDAARPRVLALLWDAPLYAVGRQSFVSELIALAGGDNLGDRVDRPYFQASPEWVIESDPDAIFCLFHIPSEKAVARLRATPAFAALTAVRQGRVVGGFDVDLILRPGPRVMRGVAQLRDGLSRKIQQEQP